MKSDRARVIRLNPNPDDHPRFDKILSWVLNSFIRQLMSSGLQCLVATRQQQVKETEVKNLVAIAHRVQRNQLGRVPIILTINSYL